MCGCACLPSSLSAWFLISTAFMLALRRERYGQEDPTRLQGHLVGPGLAELPASCFPPLATTQRNKSRVDEKRGGTETVGSRAGRAFPCSGAPLKGKPAASRGECGAPVDGYNLFLQPCPVLLFCSYMDHQFDSHTSNTWLYGLIF